VKRSLAIDGFRGLMLVIIALDHVKHNPFFHYTWQTFGFISAAEGFVFLSGLLAGFVYGKLARSPNLLSDKVLSRIFLIGISWMLMHTLVFSFHCIYDQTCSPWIYLKELFFLPNPLAVESVLGLYLVLVLLLYPVLRLLDKGYAVRALAGSFLLYFITVFVLLYSRLPSWQSAPLDIINQLSIFLNGGNQFGKATFSIPAWQLLFVIGVVLGYCWRQGRQITVFANPMVVVATFIFFLLQFLVRHEYFSMPFLEAMANRQALGPVRLVAFLCAALLVYNMARNWRTFIGVFRFPIVLGRHSLYVFVFSNVIVVGLISPLMGKTQSNFLSLCLLMLLVVSLYLPCWVREKFILNNRKGVTS